MQLTGLQPLYRSMRQQDIGRTKFRYHLNDLVFECLFFADTAPFELVMGCLGHNFAIFVDVRPGFEITPYIEPTETFFALREALFKGRGSANRFDPVAFFAEFNRHIPSHAAPDQTPTPGDVVRWYPDMEDADKRFFCGWLDNNKKGNQVSVTNLAKTRRLLGQRTHDFAQRRNQSTRWTHEQSKAIAFFMPE
jgi:Family of unknown function (DUF6037)